MFLSGEHLEGMRTAFVGKRLVHGMGTKALEEGGRKPSGNQDAATSDAGSQKHIHFED